MVFCSGFFATKKTSFHIKEPSHVAKLAAGPHAEPGTSIMDDSEGSDKDDKADGVEAEEGDAGGAAIQQPELMAVKEGSVQL